ncbi:hypothetical protein [Desulfogranum mediterraneum]|uniref:hypothetical protein n=1 Tax=Desulfogranum mediterraneum TaxID=160661 RepID=UPI001378BFB0|nr:hypothetical protein [Desulfogranum mediterraneum]
MGKDNNSAPAKKQPDNHNASLRVVFLISLLPKVVMVVIDDSWFFQLRVWIPGNSDPDGVVGLLFAALFERGEVSIQG